MFSRMTVIDHFNKITKWKCKSFISEIPFLSCTNNASVLFVNKMSFIQYNRLMTDEIAR